MRDCSGIEAISTLEENVLRDGRTVMSPGHVVKDVVGSCGNQLGKEKLFHLCRATVM